METDHEVEANIGRGAWRFIGEYILSCNRVPSTKVVSIGEIAVSVNDLSRIVLPNPITGFDGITVGLNISKDGNSVTPFWKVMKQGRPGHYIPNKSFGMEQYGYSESFRFAVMQRAKFLGLSGEYIHAIAPSKETIIEHLKKRIGEKKKSFKISLG